MAVSSKDTLAALRQLEPYEFEHAVAEVWRGMGWDAEVSQQSNDRGIDIVATKSEGVTRKELIQAKRYGSDTTVGSPEIQQYASLRQQVPDADSVVVVTTGQFSSNAEEVAQQMNVKLVDGAELADLVERHAPGLVDGGATQASTPRVSEAQSSAAGTAASATGSIGKRIAADAARNPEDAVRLVLLVVIGYAMLNALWPLVFGGPSPLPRIYELFGY